MSFYKKRLSGVSRFLLLVVALCTGLSPLLQAQAYTFAARENLAVLPALEQEKTNIYELFNEESVNKFDQVSHAALRMQLYPTESTRRLSAFRLACGHEMAQAKKNRTVPTLASALDIKSCQDLELLAGPKSNPLAYVASSIDRTSTELGRIALYKNVTQPTDDIQELQRRQAVVKELVQNEQLFKIFDERLKAFVVPENALLSLWGDDVFKDLMGSYLISLPAPKEVNDWLSKKPAAVAYQDVQSVVGNLLHSYKLSIAIPTLVFLGLSNVAGIKMQKQVFGNEIRYPTAQERNLTGWRAWLGTAQEKMATFADSQGIGTGKDYDYYTISGLIGYTLDKMTKSTYQQGASRLSEAAFKSLGLWGGYKGLKARVSLLKALHTKLRYVATYLKAVAELAKEVSKNNTLKAGLPMMRNLNCLYGKLNAEQQELKELLELLGSSTFKSKFSVLSYAGRIFAAYHRISEIKDLFVDTMMAVGELDAVMSTARLVKEFEGKRVQFCFPTYKAPVNGHPELVINNFWNTMIKPEKVITNSCHLGGDAARNMVITGPNAGGKSTILKGAVMSVIMAQTLGIAAAESMTLTPFSKITAYLNITDDIAEGNSHFKAGVKRAKEVIESVKSVRPGKVTLTMVDELFNGTSHREGEAAAYSFTKMLGSVPHNISLACSHFSLVPTLAQKDSSFANYKVSVTYDEKGSIKYPYTLTPGISNQVITLKILEEEGFGKQFIDDARSVLDKVQ